MLANTTTLQGTCGVGLCYGFRTEGYGSNVLNLNLAANAGIGFSIAGFTNTRICKQMYKHINSKYKIVFQSPVKRNRNSGNQFFFIVFTNKENVCA